jgi:hypothetical protein
MRPRLNAGIEGRFEQAHGEIIGKFPKTTDFS